MEKRTPWITVKGLSVYVYPDGYQVKEKDGTVLFSDCRSTLTEDTAKSQFHRDCLNGLLTDMNIAKARAVAS